VMPDLKRVIPNAALIALLRQIRQIVPEAAIDPLALILRSDIYTLIHLPDPPPEVEELKQRIRALVQRMTPPEKERALDRVHAFRTYAEAAEHELRTE
jgi:hypothetical protein